MSTTWTLVAGEICADALQHLGVLAAGEPASGADMQAALNGLDSVLKELPLHGYSWPKLSTETALTWGGAGVQTMVLPTDYYGNPVAWKTLAGSKVWLTQIPHGTWIGMTERTAAGPATHFYVSPAGVFHLYPVPADADPVVTLQYQRIVSDADLATTPDIPQYWVNPLGYGVANEIALKFSVPGDRRLEIAQRWAAKRDRALANSIAHETICFEVRD